MFFHVQQVKKTILKKSSINFSKNFSANTDFNPGSSGYTLYIIQPCYWGPIRCLPVVKEGDCGNMASGGSGRENAHGTDLNRNFPDQFRDGKEQEDLLRGREPETLAAMTWIGKE